MSQKLLTGQAVILAAGESSRCWPINHRHKSLIKIMGRPLIWYLIKGLQDSGIKEIIIVQNPKKDVEEELKEYEISNLKYVIQQKPKGPGDAILKTEKLVRGQFLVLNTERIDAREYVQPILNKAEKTKSKLIILAGPTKTPGIFGILKVKGDKVLDLVEKPKKGKEASNLKIVGIYFLPKDFFPYLKKMPIHPYSLEHALLLYAKERDVRIVNTKKETLALKYPWDLFSARNYIFDNFLKAKVAKSAKISKGAKILGKVYIGEKTKVFEGAIIKGPCYIGNNCTIGNALIRDYTDIEDNVLIGTMAEVTRSIFQENCETHSGFFGDSIFCRGCKVGAGTITANVRIDRGEIKAIIKGERINTGFNRLGCFLGENVTTGIHCSFMPGVLIGAGSIVGPCSLVSENIKENTVYYQKFEKVVER
jgi:bifunctional UDP-N-acetylglucosamine pyrophosphorylase/glucosamine-1-phosphate N-acetyltransferase